MLYVMLLNTGVGLGECLDEQYSVKKISGQGGFGQVVIVEVDKHSKQKHPFREAAIKILGIDEDT